MEPGEVESTKRRSSVDLDMSSTVLGAKRAKRQRSSTLPADNTKQTNQTTQHSRTVYLGQLPLHISYTEIFDVIKSGPVESIRLLPEKDCAFVDFCSEADAERFRVKYRGKRLSLRGQDVKVSIAKPSYLSETVLLAMQWGATRNVYFSGVTISTDEEVRLWEERLRRDCERFGPIDTVKVVPEKAIAFVHMCRIQDAMEVVSWLSADPAWRDKRVNFGTDRCGGPQERPALRSTPALRTVYFGGIPKDYCNLEKVCEQVVGGLLEQVRVLKEKQSAFITFIRCEDAERFHSVAQADGVFIGGTRVKVGWASERALSMSTIHALQRGATRCVQIDNLDLKRTVLSSLVSELEDKYGQVESAHKRKDNDKLDGGGTVYISFASIKEACDAVNGLRFDRAFHGCKVSFTRDKCSIPAVPKPHGVESSAVPTMPYPVYPMMPYPLVYNPYDPYNPYNPYNQYQYPPPPQ